MKKKKLKKGSSKKWRCTECGVVVVDACGEPKLCDNCESRWSFEEIKDE